MNIRHPGGLLGRLKPSKFDNIIAHKSFIDTGRVSFYLTIFANSSYTMNFSYSLTICQGKKQQAKFP